MKPRTITWLVIVALLTVLIVRVLVRKPPPAQPKRPPAIPAKPAAAAVPKDGAAPPKPAEPYAPATPGELKLSDDADGKQGDFWLEQALDATGLAGGAHLLDLYVALDPQTQSGIRVRLNDSEVALEEGAAGAEARDAAAAPIAKAALPQPLSGTAVLGVLWRRGEMSIWLGAQQVLAWRPQNPPRLPSGKPLALNAPSGTHVFAAGVRLGARRTLPLAAIRFNDTFMRDTNTGAWAPLAGKWELTAMAFPERSANPFSLRTSFGAEEAVDDKIYQGRTREHDYGLGIVISGLEGTLHIERITGGGPAAHAGLAEGDIFLAIDGAPVDSIDGRHLQQLFFRGFGGDVRLRVLRPGEKQPREFRITREHYRWGTPAEGIPIPPVREPETIGADQVALIVAGEPGWGDYTAEASVKPLGTGGVGLAVGVLSSRDYLVFRWRGPASRQMLAAEQRFVMPLAKPVIEDRSTADRLQLVRVSGGRETVLCERAAGYRPYEFYRLGVDWNGDAVTCFVDGNQVLTATVPELKRGQVALYALKGEPAFFDDVRVYSDRAALAAAQHPETAVNQIFASEEDMAVWGNPALEWERDIKTGWAIHKGRFPGEQALVINKPRFNELTAMLKCGDNGEGSAFGPKLTVANGVATLAGDGFTPASANIGKGPFQRLALRTVSGAGNAPASAEADIDGAHLAARCERGAAQPESTARPDRVAIRGLKNLGDPNALRVSSSNLLEYTFNAAPTDWKVECGRWGLLNKWICDPRWSWFGGRTKTLAALWHKDIFSGDIAVDAHVALMMQQEDPPYERSGDYNIAICGDGMNLDSGYTLIFGGDNNSWTRLFRKGQLVAESTKEEHRIFSDRIRHPDKPDLHQRWFHVKLEKRGSVVSFFRDDALAFAFNDPQPLTEGRVAFWTLDNGFLLSRVRIAHNGARPAAFEPRRASLFEDAQVINVFDGEVFTAVGRQALPPGIQAALAAPKDAFKPAEADAAPADNKQPPDAGAAPAYRVANGTGGGPFALQWKNMLVDPASRGVLRFACRIEPGANVDLYLLDVQAGRNLDPRRTGAYRWRLTGPRESDEFAPLVGEVPGVQADGRWHAVQFDVSPSWRNFWKERGVSRPRPFGLRPMIGNLDNHGYLLAGMNGNHAGAAYSVSAITVLTPRESDGTPPRVERVVWPYDADGDGRSVAIVFNDAGGSGILDESLELLLNDVSVPREMASFDHVAQTLRVDLPPLNLPPFTATPTLKLRLPGFQDRAQNPGAAFSASYTFDPAAALKAAKPVAAPLVSVDMAGDNDAVPSGGALRLADISPVTPVARLQESADAPPWAPCGQRSSVQVVAPQDGSTFGFAINNMGYNLRHWPYLRLDYKMPPETPVNLHFYDQTGARRALVLGDTGDALDPLSQDVASRAGPPAEFICDGSWRRTIVPFQRMFAGAIPQPASATVRGFALHDNGWRGSRRGMQYWIHRIQPLPAGRTADFRFSWRAADVSGIGDYAACLDDKPESDPQGKQEIASGETLQAALGRRGAGLQDGWNYLHVRVKNGAGVWSEPTHTQFMLDNTPPRVIRTEPPDGGTCAGQALTVFLDESGVDFFALRMGINGQLVQGWHGLKHDPVENSITLNAAAAGMPWPDKTKVSVDVYGLKDLFGNQTTAPFSFSFMADKGEARPGPSIAQVRYCAPAFGGLGNRQMDMEISFSLDFEQHTGHVRAMRDCRMEWLDDRAQACYGRRAVKFTALDDDANAQVMLHKNPWYVDRAPLLQFDYKADAGMRVDILVEVLGQWLSVRFTGDGAAPEGGKAIGQVEAVMADGSWRHASVDLKSLLDAAWPGLPVRIINQVILSAQGRDGCKRGASITLDNLELARANGAGRFDWQAGASASGVAGYAFVLDQDATTIPPEQINETGASTGVGVRTGVWFGHIRACDQAGNWGPTRTVRVDLGE